MKEEPQHCNQDQAETQDQGRHQLDQSLGHLKGNTIQDIPVQDRTGAVQGHPLLAKDGPIAQGHHLQD